MLYFAVEDGNDTTANVTLENGSDYQVFASMHSTVFKYRFFFQFFFKMRF